MLIYLTALVFGMVGYSYAAVPLYRRFCQATGYGGTAQRHEKKRLLGILEMAQLPRVVKREILSSWVNTVHLERNYICLVG
ncbi:hypothetical protein Dimus_036541, partial [Dionaea muscipula]